MVNFVMGKKYRITVDATYKSESASRSLRDNYHWFKDSHGYSFQVSSHDMVLCQEIKPDVRSGDVWLDETSRAWLVDSVSKFTREWVVYTPDEFFRNHPSATRIHRES